MKYNAGLDVSVKETSFCIIDGTGAIYREKKLRIAKFSQRFPARLIEQVMSILERP